MMLVIAGGTVLVTGGVGLWMVNREFTELHQSMYDEDAAWEEQCAKYDEARAERDRLHPELAGTVFSMSYEDGHKLYKDYRSACWRTDESINRLRGL
jgi:hypothetical protein